MKGINPLLIIIVVIVIIILFAIFANTSTSISNIANNIVSFNFSGSFNQSLNTSDSVLFNSVNASRFNGSLDCKYIVGGSDPDYCIDGGSVGNPFNQSLNTSDNVMFNNINVTGFINLTGALYAKDSISFMEFLGATHYINFTSASPTIKTGGAIEIRSQIGGIDDTNSGAGNGGNLNLISGNGGATVINGVNAGVGGQLFINSGDGGNSGDGAIAAGTGGTINILAGNGGANTASGAGGTGGRVSITGGNAGSGALNRNGGNVFIAGGLKSNSGTDGNIILARLSTGSNIGKVLIATATANGDIFRVAGNSTFDGNISSPSVANRMGLNSPIARNYSLNTLNINASSYSTNGSDFAEAVPKLDTRENITSGDIVGIYPGGKASKNTVGAFSVMVVSGNTIGMLSKEADFLENYVMGKRNVTEEILNTTTINILNVTENNVTTVINKTIDILVNVTYEATDIGTRFKEDFTNTKYLPVAFAGQIPVKINGLCIGGNWVIPSGLNDGLGKCVDPKAAISIAGFAEWVTQKVCIAWENKETLGVGKINCAVMGSN